MKYIHVSSMVVVAFMVFAIAIPASAQVGSCRDIIPPDGARRVINLEESSSLSIVDYSASHATMTSNKGDSFKIKVTGYGDGSSAKSRAKASIVGNTSFYALKQDRYINARILEGDKNIIAAWQICMTSRGGPSVEISSPSKEVVVAKISWVRPRLSSITSSPLRQPIAKENLTIRQNSCGDVGADIDEVGCTVIFERVNWKNDAMIFVSTRDGDDSVFIPPSYSVTFREYPYSSRTYPLEEVTTFPTGGGDTIPVDYRINLAQPLIERGFALSEERPTISVVDSTFIQGHNRGACDVASYPPSSTPHTIRGSVLIWSNKAYPAFCKISAKINVMVGVVDGEAAPSQD